MKRRTCRRPYPGLAKAWPEMETETKGGLPWAGEQGRVSLLSRAGPDGVQICAPPCRYLCCETQMELREWLATFLFVQVPGAGCRAGVGSQKASITEHVCVCASSLFRPLIASGF